MDIALKKNYSKFHSPEGTPLSAFTPSIQEFILEFKYLPLSFYDEYIPADCEIGSRWYVEKDYCSEDILFEVTRKDSFNYGNCAGYAVINMGGQSADVRTVNYISNPWDGSNMTEKSEVEAWMMSASLEELQEVVSTYNTALRLARERVAAVAKMSLSIDDEVHFISTRRGTVLNGTLNKLMRKNCLIQVGSSQWKVPLAQVKPGHIEVE